MVTNKRLYIAFGFSILFHLFLFFFLFRFIAKIDVGNLKVIDSVGLIMNKKALAERSVQLPPKETLDFLKMKVAKTTINKKEIDRQKNKIFEDNIKNFKSYHPTLKMSSQLPENKQSNSLNRINLLASNNTGIAPKDISDRISVNSKIKGGDIVVPDRIEEVGIKKAKFSVDDIDTKKRVRNIDAKTDIADDEMIEKNSVSKIPVVVPEEKKKIEFKEKRVRSDEIIGDNGYQLEGPLSNRKVIKKNLPRIPGWLKEKNITETKVSIRFYVNKSGNILDDMKVEQSSGYPIFDQIVMDSLKKWIFEQDKKGITKQYGVITFKFVIE
jgi:TonB family protein